MPLGTLLGLAMFGSSMLSSSSGTRHQLTPGVPLQGARGARITQAINTLKADKAAVAGSTTTDPVLLGDGSGYVPLGSSSGSIGGGVPVSMILPPGGFAGAAQQSAAVRHSIAKAAGRKGGRRSAARRRKKKPAAKRAAKRRRSPAKKGSTAMKRRMAKLRSMRKKK